MSMTTAEAGRKGSLVRWGSRPEILIELSKYTDKELQNVIMKWKETMRLKRLLEFFQRNNNK